MSASTDKVKIKRSQERTEVTKQSLIVAALKAFSERGFDAVTVREIEVLAGVQRNLVSYHFGSKDELWKEVALYNLEQLAKFTEGRGELLRDISSTREKIAYIVRSFVRFSAKHPELNRMLVEEGTQDSWRIKWLVENHIRPLMQTIEGLVKTDLKLSDKEFISWYYMLLGGGAMIFSLAPEAKLLFDIETSSDDIVEQHANMLTDMLLLKMPAASSAN